VLLMYQQGFRWWNMGYAAAVAFVLFAIILCLTLVAVRFRSSGTQFTGSEQTAPTEFAT
jgi:ABC-type sugar transport system permease subunit